MKPVDEEPVWSVVCTYVAKGVPGAGGAAPAARRRGRLRAGPRRADPRGVPGASGCSRRAKHAPPGARGAGSRTRRVTRQPSDAASESRPRADRTLPGSSSQGKCPAPSTAMTQAPGIRSAVSVEAVSGMGLRAPATNRPGCRSPAARPPAAAAARRGRTRSRRGRPPTCASAASQAPRPRSGSRPAASGAGSRARLPRTPRRPARASSSSARARTPTGVRAAISFSKSSAPPSPTAPSGSTASTARTRSGNADARCRAQRSGTSPARPSRYPVAQPGTSMQQENRSLPSPRPAAEDDVRILDAKHPACHRHTLMASSLPPVRAPARAVLRGGRGPHSETAFEGPRARAKRRWSKPSA